MRVLRPLLAFALAACGPQVAVPEGDTTGLTHGEAEVGPTVPDDDADADADDADVDGEDEVVDGGWDFYDPPEPTECGKDASWPCPYDILVVVDNSSGMAEPQLSVVRGLLRLVRELENEQEDELAVDVQMMFTTTDVGNPYCTPFQAPDYTPAMGAPTTTGCNARIDRFTPVSASATPRPDVCTNACPVDVVPSDPFIAFQRDESDNVPDVPFADIDGDGELDSPVAQAAACLAPQGIDGCGYEAPLAAMLSALDPEAAWNGGDRPFLRPDSRLMIVLVTDEADCSMDSFAVMDDPEYQQLNPDTGQYAPSSAICWNAGVTCLGPDATGVYQDCTATSEPLAPISRYTDYLVDELQELEGRAVGMIAVTGVPPVTEHAPTPPYEPIAGGLPLLVTHAWHNGLFPAGDMLPNDLANGIDAEDKTFQFLMGPGCTALDEATGRSVQAIPNPRVHEVCSALNPTDPDSNDMPVRCIVESICDETTNLDAADGWLKVLPKG